MFGDECTTEEQFRKTVATQIALQYKSSSDYKFSVDTRKALIDQVGELKFPEASLKKWLLSKDEKRDAKKLDEDFPKMMEDLTWQLIEEKIVAANDIKISDDDIKAEATGHVQAQMAQYGLTDIPEEYVKQYAEDMVKDEKQRGQLRDSAITRKIMNFVGNAITLEQKEVTFEEFQKLLA